MQQRNIRRLGVYCGSSPGAQELYLSQARALGRALAVRGIGLVYGGGGLGLMGACAEAVLAEHGEVIGVIPHSLAGKERLNTQVTELHRVNTMHERKAMMVALADGFIALPGGFGTFDELFETITWAQLGIHQKPIGLLNVAGYFDPLLALVERAVQEGFVQEKYRRLFVISTDVEDLLTGLHQHEPLEGLIKWLNLNET